jgi:spore maturation protein CgeB
VDYRFRNYLKAGTIRQLFSYDFKNSLFSNIKSKLFSFKILLFPGSSLKNVEQIKARNFEIPGTGGFELSQYAPGIEDYYTIGSELAVYSNLDELKVMIKYYLFNDNVREKIRLSGYKRTKKYTYKNRYMEIFKKIKV